MYKSLVSGDEFLAQGLKLKLHQRCSAGIRIWLSAVLPHWLNQSFIFEPCLIHRVMLEWKTCSLRGCLNTFGNTVYILVFHYEGWWSFSEGCNWPLLTSVTCFALRKWQRLKWPHCRNPLTVVFLHQSWREPTNNTPSSPSSTETYYRKTITSFRRQPHWSTWRYICCKLH